MMTFWLIPFVCILLESFRMESTYQVGYILPKVWGFGNYVNLIQKTDFVRWFFNTFAAGLAVSVFQTAFVLATSYALSRIRFRGRKTLMNLMLILGMFPGFITLIVLYRVLSGWGIILPMSGPIVVYTVLMGFMAPWGDFVYAKYIAHNTSAGMNVAVGIQNMISTPAGMANYYTQFCAAGVIVAIPVTVLFMLLQKYYVEGVTGGAVKG